MSNPKLRATIVVLIVGVALGVSVFAASHLFLRPMLIADAHSAAEELARISHNVSQLRPCDATKPSLLNDLPECARNSVFNSLFVRIPSVKSLIQRVLSWQERAGPIGDEISGLASLKTNASGERRQRSLEP